MRYKLLLIITIVTMILVSCSDSTEPDNDGITIIDHKIFEGFTGFNMIKASDNSIVLGVSNGDPGIVKLDINGNMIWEKYYSIGNEDDFIENLTETSDNGFLISGSASEGSSAGFIAKTDSLGNLIWKKDSINSMLYRKVLENNLGEVIFVRHTGSEIAIVEKYDSNGNLIWTGHFSYDLNDISLPVLQVHDFTISPENDIYIIYRSYRFSSNLVKIKISNSGEFDDGFYSHIDCQAGSIFFKDYTHYIFGSFDASNNDISFLYTFPSNQSSYLESFFDQLESFNGYYKNNFTEDGGIIATDHDWIVKLDANFELEWNYKVDWTTTKDWYVSTIDTGNNLYALLGTTEWTVNDSTKHGTFIRFFEKN